VVSWHHNLVIGFSSLSFSMALESFIFSHLEMGRLYIQCLLWKWFIDPWIRCIKLLGCIIMLFDHVLMNCKGWFIIWL
jgi:hypothetical protein